MTSRQIEIFVITAIRKLAKGRVIRVYIADVVHYGKLKDVDIELVHAALNQLENQGLIAQYCLDDPKERTTRHETYANYLGAGNEPRHILYADPTLLRGKR